MNKIIYSAQIWLAETPILVDRWKQTSTNASIALHYFLE